MAIANCIARPRHETTPGPQIRLVPGTGTRYVKAIRDKKGGGEYATPSLVPTRKPAVIFDPIRRYPPTGTMIYTSPTLL